MNVLHWLAIIGGIAYGFSWGIIIRSQLTSMPMVLEVPVILATIAGSIVFIILIGEGIAKAIKAL